MTSQQIIQLKVDRFFGIIKKDIDSIKSQVMDEKVEKLRGHFRRSILETVFMLKDIGLKPDQINESKIFHHEPFSRGVTARKFFQAVKDGNYD